MLVIAARWRAASRPGRRALLPSVAGSLCALLFAALLVGNFMTATRPVVLDWLDNTALLAVPAAFLAGLLRSRLARGGLAELFRELGTMRGARLQAGLAKTLDDPSLVLGFPCRSRTRTSAWTASPSRSRSPATAARWRR